MTTKTIIKNYSVEQRQQTEWRSLKGLLGVFTEQEIIEQVQRYQDAQRHAVAYRERAKLKATMLKDRLALLEARLAEEEGD